MAMLDGNLTRRGLLAGLVSTVTAIGGCSQVADIGGTSGSPDSEEETPENPPNPAIIDVNAEIGNFQQTQEESKTLLVLENKGGLGEVKVAIQAQGTAAVYDESESLFSLQAGQEHQLGYDLYTHEGAEEIRITAQSTKVPQNKDTVTVSPESTPKMVDYEDDSQ